VAIFHCEEKIKIDRFFLYNKRVMIIQGQRTPVIFLTGKIEYEKSGYATLEKRIQLAQ